MGTISCCLYYNDAPIECPISEVSKVRCQGKGTAHNTCIDTQLILSKSWNSKGFKTLLIHVCNENI